MLQALTHGRNRNSILGSPTTPGYVVALRLNLVLSGYEFERLAFRPQSSEWNLC